jgi:hypothetical protein
MSYVFASPEWVTAAANDLASIGSALNAASSEAAAPTSGVPAAGADGVSALIAALFSAHGQAFQTLSAQAAMFHQQFVQLMSGGAAQYAAAEALNATPMQDAAAAVSAPLQAMGGFSPGGSAAAAPISGGKKDEHVLATSKNGVYVQIGTGAPSGAGISAVHAAGGPPSVSPGSAGSPGLVTGGGASGLLLGSPAAITGPGAGVAATNGVVTAAPAGGLGGAAFGDGGPGMGGVLGQAPTTASTTVDRAIVGAPASRGGDEGHAGYVPSSGEHSGGAESATPALDAAGEPSTAERGLFGGSGPLYGGGNGFYAHAGSDGSTELLQHRAPGLPS